jgi:microcin C transport system ATP-binding protein
VLITGQPWARRAADNRAQRRRVQVVFQDPFSSLSPRMTVAELVGEGLAIHEPQLTPAQRQARVLAALQAVGLPDGCETQGAHAPQPTAKAIAPGPNDRLTPEQLLARYPHEFSGGQRQRLAIARALVVNPEVLVLDEPTSALDVTVQKQVVDLLLRLQRDRGLSYLLITHDMNVVQAMAHDVLVLQGGRVVEQGAWAQVRTQPAHPHTQALLNALA